MSCPILFLGTAFDSGQYVAVMSHADCHISRLETHQQGAFDHNSCAEFSILNFVSAVTWCTLVSLPMTIWFRNAPLVYSYQIRCSKHLQYSVSWFGIQHTDTSLEPSVSWRFPCTLVGKMLGFDALWHIFMHLSSWLRPFTWHGVSSSVNVLGFPLEIHQIICAFLESFAPYKTSCTTTVIQLFSVAIIAIALHAYTSPACWSNQHGPFLLLLTISHWSDSVSTQTYLYSCKYYRSPTSHHRNHYMWRWA